MREPPFYVGQRVICVDDSFQECQECVGRYLMNAAPIKKGQIYTIYGIEICNCRCQDWIVDVGLASESDLIYCDACNMTDIKTKNRNFWMNATRFAPIHEGFQAITFQKIMELELASVN